MRLNPTTISIIKRLLGGKNNRPLKSILSRVEPADLASLLSNLNRRDRNLLIEALISTDQAAEVLKELPDQKLEIYLTQLEKPKLLVLLNYFAEEDSAYFLNLFSKEEQTQLLSQLSQKRRSRLQQILSYPEDSAGRLMNTFVFTLPENLTAQEAIRCIREKSQEKSFYYIYCVSEQLQLKGVISLRELVTASTDCKITELSKKDIISIPPDTSAEDVAQLVDRYGFIAVPVVSQENQLLGVITVDEVVDIIQEQATADIYASAGLQEDDRVYSPASRSIKSRLPWMLLNLILASYVSSVVSLFENTMSQIIILASLNNIVAGMGGNTAIQSLTIFTRGLALDDFQYISKFKAILKESIVGLVNGVITGVFAGLLVYFWKSSATVGMIICVSMILNSLIAATVGSVVPLILKRYNLDPAAGSGVLVTTLTDSFGFFSFLGIASLVLKYYGHL